MEINEYERLRDIYDKEKEVVEINWKKVLGVDFNMLFEESKESYQNKIIEELEIYKDHDIYKYFFIYISGARKLITGFYEQLEWINSLYEKMKELFNQLLKDYGTVLEDRNKLLEYEKEIEEMKNKVIALNNENKELIKTCEYLEDEYAGIVEKMKKKEEEFFEKLKLSEQKIDVEEVYKKFKKFCVARNITIENLKKKSVVNRYKFDFKKLCKEIPQEIYDEYWLELINIELTKNQSEFNGHINKNDLLKKSKIKK